jgi:hypothetical protein
MTELNEDDEPNDAAVLEAGAPVLRAATLREAAIAAALDALDDDITWTGMGAALDAAAPHLLGEIVRYVVVEGTLDDGAFDSPEAARKWIADRGMVGCRVAALVLVEDR